jgi:predicted protein tyrosine phosphatase
MNRLANNKNRFQGDAKRVLCCCSAGLLRSPTAAVVLSQEPYNYNTRAVGVVPEYALVPIDPVLVDWADEIVVMESWQADTVRIDFPEESKGKRVIVLNVPDKYPRMNPELVELIKKAYRDVEIFERAHKMTPLDETQTSED